MCDFHSILGVAFSEDHFEIRHSPDNSHANMAAELKNQPLRQPVIFEAEWNGQGEMPPDEKLIRNASECPERLRKMIRDHFQKLAEALKDGKHLCTGGYFADVNKWADVWSEAGRLGVKIICPDIAPLVNSSTQKAGDDSTQTAGDRSTQTAGDRSTQKAGDDSTQTAGDRSTQKAGDDSTQTAGYRSTQKAGDDSTQTAGNDSTQKAGDDSTQTAGDRSTQTAGYRSTQTAGNDSTQTAGNDSTQTAGYRSTQKAGDRSTQKAGEQTVQIIRYYKEKWLVKVRVVIAEKANKWWKFENEDWRLCTPEEIAEAEKQAVKP